MRLADLVAAVHEAFDPAAAMADVAAVCGYDRYQASMGITAAADLVAERAEAAGLARVEVLTFPADGARRWWSYRAPMSWTPIRAWLRLGDTTLIRYPEQPYTLAAYSAPTPTGGRTAPLLRWSDVCHGVDPSGSIVVVDTRAALSAVIGPSAGAVAIVADPQADRPNREPGQVGRLELPPGSRSTALSVDASRLAALIAAADAGGVATIEVVTDTASRTMPVVTGRLAGTGPADADEVLLSAHLCHPRPSANDNATGVAALLGVARVLASGEFDRPGDDRPAVRFLWGPEFTGMAAYLHDVVHAGAARVPILAMNVDMAGPDVRRLGGPLVIERGPDDLPSFLPALADRCAALLPPRSRSYSGAVPCDAWTWRSTPYAGGSDHALPADVPTRCPVVSLGHWPDRSNHSSSDTLDAVDPDEVRRTGVVVASAVAALRGRSDPRLAADVADATAAWAADHVLAVLPGRRSPRGAPPPGVLLDALDDGQARRWSRHRAAVASGAIRTLGTAGVGPTAITSTVGWLALITTAAATRLARPGPEPEPGRADRDVLTRRRPGPANLRAVAEAAMPTDRDWLDARIAEDRGGNHARALALLGGVNGVRSRRDAAWWAACASEVPIPVEFADRFFDLLCRAGWVTAEDGGG